MASETKAKPGTDTKADSVAHKHTGIVLRIEPMDRSAMTWHDVTTEPPLMTD